MYYKSNVLYLTLSDLIPVIWTDTLLKGNWNHFRTFFPPKQVLTVRMLLWNKNSHKSMVPVYLLNILLKRFFKLIDAFNKMMRHGSLLFLIAKRPQPDWAVSSFHCWGKLACAAECLKGNLTDLRAGLRQANVFYRQQDDQVLRKVDP